MARLEVGPAAFTFAGYPFHGQHGARVEYVPPVAVPTLGLWSTGDRYLTEDRMVRSAEYVTGPWRYARIEGASHWMQLDAPQRVNDLLREFIVESEPPVFPRTPEAR